MNQLVGSEVQTPPRGTPPGSPQPGEEIPLASSYPVINKMTPRARRREALKSQMEKKKKENQSRARAAAIKRARAAENDPSLANTRNNRGRGIRKNTVKGKPPLSSPAKKKQVPQRNNSSSSSNNNNNRRYRSRRHNSTNSVSSTTSTDSLSSEADLKFLQDLKAQVTSLAAEKHAVDEVKQALERELEMTKEEHNSVKQALEKELEMTKAELLSVISANAELKELLAQKNETEANLRGINDELASNLSKSTVRIEELEATILENERTKRDLRNTILELKGNIRVFARVRPLLQSEKNGKKVFQFPLDDPEKEHITLVGEPKKSVDNRSSVERKWDFKFDKVFHEQDGQSNVFKEVSHLVQSALDGYKVCVFAYGQTGSGKTYTMEGSEKDMGIIPRAVDHLFNEMKKKQEKQGWTFEMKASFLEIYNETIRDLSQTENKKGETFDIRHTREGETIVNGLQESVVKSPEDVHKLINIANKNRAVGSTNMNERSSRSHSVFTLTLVGTHVASGEKLRGTLNLVDLAGSERLANSKATGTTLKETRAINKSLSCLGDVIFSLADESNKNKHIPYRNSKLTYLLQNSLGGNSKTLMLVNLSPVNSNESLCSLRFAHKVNSCDIGTAKTVKVQKM